jgi:GTP:adenosylcobinamide-phosphate guanylyltransferase
MPVAALILAGGNIKPKHAADWRPLLPDGATNRALVELAGKPMVSYVVDAVKATPGIGRILIAGDVPTPSGCTAVAGGSSLVETLLNGVAALEPSETRLFVVTADVPFLTSEAIADLLKRAPEADFVYSIVEASVCEATFPTMRRTTLKVAEGIFTGGNMVLIRPDFLRNNAATVHQAYALRKNIPGLAAMLGPGVILRLIASRVAPNILPLAALEAAVSRALGGATAVAFISPHAGVGADIDRPEDVAIARAYLRLT